jgi:hypothetical protein
VEPGRRRDPRTGGSTTDPGLVRAEDLAVQVRVLIAQSAIRDLAATYAMAVDDHDLPGVLACFAPSGAFTRAEVTVAGLEGLRAFYVDAMARYDLMVHTPHSQVVTVDGSRARGVATGHAELWLENEALLTAYRYHDDFVEMEGRWVIAHRRLLTRYAAPLEEVRGAFADGRTVRWPSTVPRAADDLRVSRTWPD